MSNPTSPTFPEIDDLKTKLKTNTPLIPLFKGVLKKILKQQQQQFLEAPKDTVEHLVKQRSQVIDQLLILVWQQFFSESQSISLIAGGGYGRGELHPHSDIDLMILVANDDLQDHQEAIESFLTFLWDIGLDVGHSVRSINESISECKEDITIATNLMESRLIIGEETHFQSMREQTTSDQTWTGTRFFEAKLEEQKKRHLKFHDTAYNLEPNIKENPGGLRDIQAIGWVAKRHFNVDRLDDLVDKGFLTPIELDTLKQGQNYLWRIRFALHIIAKRREDRFLFDHQRTVAEILGFKDTKTIAAVESMMQSYFRTVLELNRLNELLLQLFKEAILYPTDNPTIQPINNRFQSHNGYLETVSDNVFKRTPFALLEFFLIKQQHPELKGIRASTIRLIRDNTHLIDDQFRQDIRNISLFIEIMRQPHGLTHELRRMNRYGILAAYLPVFNNIVGRMQYDLFHIYTVDEHTLMVIRNLRRMTVPTFAHELPHCSEIIQQIPKQELLYLAGLFHDIAKGRGGDHSKLGAMDAEQFCQLHRLGQYDTKLVTWIIRSHLIMSSTAQRKDISDPDVVLEFANIVGDVNHLNYLYLLTIADIRATDPKLWNSWKDSLLKELYHKTKIALQQDPGKLINRNELIQDTKNSALAYLHDYKISEKEAFEFWQQASSDYFVSYSGEEIAWQLSSILNNENVEHVPQVYLRKHPRRASTELFIYTHDSDALFSVTASVINSIGLSILDARIITTKNNYTLNSFLIIEDDGIAITEHTREQQIITKMLEHLTPPISPPIKSSQKLPRQIKNFPITTQISFSNDPKEHFTIVDLITSDKPGLLSRVGLALVQCNINLHNAKIHTIGARAEDSFYITDKTGKILETEAQFNCLKTTILDCIQIEN